MKLMWRVTCNVGKLRGLLKIQGKGGGGGWAAIALLLVFWHVRWSRRRGNPQRGFSWTWLIAPFGGKHLPNSAVVRRGIRPTRKPESKAGRLSTTWIKQISPVDVLRGGGKATNFDAAFILRDPAHPAASTFCSSLHRDEMQLPCDHNSSVSAVRGSDEAQSNPPPESPTQSLSGLSPLC